MMFGKLLENFTKLMLILAFFVGASLAFFVIGLTLVVVYQFAQCALADASSVFPIHQDVIQGLTILSVTITCALWIYTFTQ